MVVGESDLLVICSSLIHSELKGLELSMETLGKLWTWENWPHPNFELQLAKSIVTITLSA